jgi:hypothetical protein
VIGLLQPDSGVFSLMHWQAVTMAAWLRLRESVPEQAATFWQQHRREVTGRFNRAKVKQSTRHWFEIGHIDYLRALDKTLGEMEKAA